MIYTGVQTLDVFNLLVAFKLQGLSAIFMAAASTRSKYSASASVLGKIALKATNKFINEGFSSVCHMQDVYYVSCLQNI